MTDFSQWWWQAAGVGPGPGPDAGDPIGQSLRFRGVLGQKLIGSSAIAVDDTYTLSFWYKHTHNTTRHRGAIFTNDGDAPYLSFNANNTGYSGIEVYNGSAYVLYPPNSVGSFRQLRDPSAWLHCVIAQVNTTSFTIYINGEQAYQTTSSQCDWNDFALGGHPTNQHICDGMIARLYHVDGQALDPTTFGRYNAQGVWVPVDPQGLTYGSNGFKLTFEDPSNIGKDYSGNGNDFTATGFNTSPPGMFSPFVTGDYDPAGVTTTLPAVAFDGDTSTRFFGLPGGTCTFAPNPPIPFNGFRIFSAGNSSSFYTFNGETRPGVSGSGAWVDFSDVSGQFDATTPLIFGGSSSYRPEMNALEINGTTILTDSNGFDYDLMQDSPTQNFAVINPLYPGASTSKANLTTANATGKPTILGLAGNVGVDGASVAWDGTEAGWNSTGAINFGQQPSGFDEISTRTMPTPEVLDGRDHFQAITGPGQGPDNGTPGQLVGNWTSGLQANTPINNASDAFNPVGGSAYAWSGEGDPQLRFVNPQKFSYTTLEIYVQVWGMDVTIDGNTTSVPLDTWTTIATNGTLEINDVITIDNVIAPTRFATLGGLKADGNLLVDGNILAISQNTFPNGLWWIKDRANSNQHQLVDSVNGTSNVITSPAGSVTAYAAPAGSSVAWCWNAANTNGGFSITNGTHGLGATPAMVIDRALNVWHQSLDAGKGLVLKSSAAATSQSWTVDGTTVSGPGGGSYYSWAEIPGYSSFGSFQGNAGADGPFIYTGHSVAWVMIKAADAAGDWQIRDNARDLDNPITATLYANLADFEYAGAGAEVDFLSNGFKLRTGDTAINGGEMIYAAFAQCPFQSPATAR